MQEKIFCKLWSEVLRAYWFFTADKVGIDIYWKHKGNQKFLIS